MCGIIGLIGNSINPDLSYKIISSLFLHSEVRGTDASGFHAIGNNIIFHKNNIPASKMVTTTEWQHVRYINPHILLGHTRAATSGIPFHNQNNQPFVDDNLTLVHNGWINEYNYLRDEFQVKSNCDSEILLQIYKRNNDILDIFNLTSGPTAFALAVDKEILLFRNEGRPLWLIDLRKSLNQIFFCSTKEIWLKTGLNSDMFSIDEYELWSLKLEQDIIIRRFKVNYSIN